MEVNGQKDNETTRARERERLSRTKEHGPATLIPLYFYLGHLSSFSILTESVMA